MKHGAVLGTYTGAEERVTSESPGSLTHEDRSMKSAHKFAFACAALLGMLTTASAQGSAPAFPTTWVNGPGFTNQQLRGKVVFLVFYEET